MQGKTILKQQKENKTSVHTKQKVEMNRRETAEKYFKSGYNCAQSVVLAYQDMIGLDETTIMKMMSSFGGGMGRLREVCGAVSGMFFVAGILYGYSEVGNMDTKTAHYQLIQDLAAEFVSSNGSIVCKDLLGLNSKDDPKPEKRSQEYYQKRPCAELVGQAAEILDNFIKSQG